MKWPSIFSPIVTAQASLVFNINIDRHNLGWNTRSRVRNPTRRKCSSENECIACATIRNRPQDDLKFVPCSLVAKKRSTKEHTVMHNPPYCTGKETLGRPWKRQCLAANKETVLDYLKCSNIDMSSRTWNILFSLE